MPQILKDSKKEEIIEAAKEEFLKNGYDNTNMRSIAFKAKMTVGNLYRYFKNKEELNQTIVGPTLFLVNQLLQKLTGNQFQLGSDHLDIDLNVTHLSEIFDRLADELVDIYNVHEKEFNILMMHSEINEKITSWFTAVLSQVIVDNYHLDANSEEVGILARGYAASLFSGVKEVLIRSKGKDSAKTLVKVYFRSYIYMLESDIVKYLPQEVL